MKRVRDFIAKRKLSPPNKRVYKRVYKCVYKRVYNYVYETNPKTPTGIFGTASGHDRPCIPGMAHSESTHAHMRAH